MFDSIFKQNYFEIFSQDISSEPDIQRLKEKNRELQQQSHPDRFANGSDVQKRQAMQITSLINEAYNVLKNPVSRLQYMLSLKGVDMSSETDTTMDGEFLMQQMELREQIADIHNQSDPLDLLDAMNLDLKKQAQLLMQDFELRYQSDDLPQSREIVRKMQFLNKAEKEIKEIIEQFEDELI